jgi:hypothetical protein
MARTIRNPKLDTRSARARLSMRDSIYWVSLALGYRKGPKGGVWLAKIVRDRTRQQTTLGPADDALDPDGMLAISYAQAQIRAREWLTTVTRPTNLTGPYTVGDAVADYLDWFKATGKKSIKETEASINALILPRLCDVDVLSLTRGAASSMAHGHRHGTPAAPQPAGGKTEGARDRGRSRSSAPSPRHREPHPDSAESRPQPCVAPGQAGLG